VIEIRAVITVGAGKFELHVDGHDETNVCAAISAITMTALLGLEEYAARYPTQVRVTITEEMD
jgi:hypothetical protein